MRALVVVGVILTLATACYTPRRVELAQACTEGRSLSCACDTGRTGAQTCSAKGAWGACVCRVPGESLISVPERSEDRDFERKARVSLAVLDDPSFDYRFVRLDDVSAPEAASDGGAQVAAVGVRRQGSERIVWAESVEVFAPVSGVGDEDAVVGAPAAFPDYPELRHCDPEAALPLGGEGGFVIVRLGTHIEQGDELIVLGVGNCSSGRGQEPPRAIEVSISYVGDANPPHWMKLGQGMGAMRFTVPELR